MNHIHISGTNKQREMHRRNTDTSPMQIAMSAVVVITLVLFFVVLAVR